MTAEGYPLRWVGQHGVVTLPAEVDVTNADEIRQALLAAASHDVAVLIIDMSETTFCDSAGVQAIIAAHQQAAATGTELRLATTAVLRILTLVGIDQLIPIYSTLQAALAAHG
jgi:anti-sigma B factor antagonist